MYEEKTAMRKRTKTLAALAGAAAAVAVATPAWAALAASPATRADGSALAFTATSGKTIVDWNQELLAIQKTPGAQPATVHPTRNLAILHAAMYDAVVSISHRDRPYLFEIDVSRNARPDAAADQAAHDVLVALYPSMQSTIDQKLAGRAGDRSDRPQHPSRHPRRAHRRHADAGGPS
jgi:hypothetical protein